MFTDTQQIESKNQQKALLIKKFPWLHYFQIFHFQKKISVRQAEVLARQFRDKKFKLIHKKDANILDLQKVLEEKTGLNVSINNKKNNSGFISFEYQNLDQLDKIIETIKNNYQLFCKFL